MRLRFPLFLLLAVACSTAACTPSQRPNIVLIVIDAFRKDRLGCYDNDRGLTPFLDSLAGRGYLFHRAYAQSSWTNPSVASLLTSRFQSQHGVISFESVLSAAEVTLPEALQDRGYRTGGFSANGLIARKFGFAQGYDEYRATLPKPNEGPRYLWVSDRADVINTKALSWLDALPHQARTFLYLHYMEPHTPYSPPASTVSQIFRGREAPDLKRINRLAFLGMWEEFDEATLRVIEDVYDAEVMSLDVRLRELFSELDRRGFLRNALVVVTADHGEEFKDHGLLGHEKTLYNEVIEVPLIVLTPGQSTRVDVDDLVSLIDVAPTILEWVGASPPSSFEGRSLKNQLMRERDGWLQPVRRFWYRDDMKPRLAFSELVKDKAADGKRFTPHKRAVLLDQRKLIAGIRGETEFYDLVADPLERNPDGLAEEDRALLQMKLEEFRRHVARAAAAGERKLLDPETKERLRALGYE